MSPSPDDIPALETVRAQHARLAGEATPAAQNPMPDDVRKLLKNIAGPGPCVVTPEFDGFDPGVDEDGLAALERKVANQHRLIEELVKLVAQLTEVTGGLTDIAAMHHSRINRAQTLADEAVRRARGV